jgi:Fic family protein
MKLKSGQSLVTFRAPAPKRVSDEMNLFLNWINGKSENLKDFDKLLRAGIAHFWFIVIHPFKDGNGRISRAITEMMLSRADGRGERLYSFATQMQNNRDVNQGVLSDATKGLPNLTVWLFWFLYMIDDVLKESEEIFGKFED